jgi:hypothetical protein
MCAYPVTPDPGRESGWPSKRSGYGEQTAPRGQTTALRCHANSRVGEGGGRPALGPYRMLVVCWQSAGNSRPTMVPGTRLCWWA